MNTPAPSPELRYLTDVHFGDGAVARLPALLSQLGVRKPLVVTDRELVRLGLVERLDLQDAAVFEGVETNPTEAAAWQALQAYRDQACDGIVALGGGSPMDLAKCVAILVHHAPPLAQYALLRGGVARISSAMPPLVVVPTTAGSGSEVGRAALLTLASGDKLAFLSDHLLPDATICDPELTLTMPPGLTAATGMDAISHCVEAFCSPRFNPVADAIALDGLERGYRAIARAVRDGGDRQARADMMLCSLQGGLAFQKGLGAVHSLSHPLGALTALKLHHGTLNAIFLPHVLRFNMGHCGDKQGTMAQRLGIDGGEALADVFARLNHDLGLPARLRDLRLALTDVEALTDKAFHDHCTATNPRALTAGDCLALYRAAW
jgi:alcohol dehydrogenase class IV